MPSFRFPSLFLMALLLCAAPVHALQKQTVMLPLRDGVKLATDLHMPTLKPGEKISAVLIRTPYGREGMAAPFLPFFQSKKIALVVQDQRGRHGSEGVSSVFLDDPADGYETVEWLAAQPWSNGKVATAGISAMGITQYIMHKNQPAASPHLVCQNVMAAPESLYHTIAYQGGAVRRGLFFGWVIGQGFPLHNMHLILSQPNYADIWEAMDISPDYEKVNIPVMHMAGWYDLYLPGNLNAFKGMQTQSGPGARGKQKLVIGPWTHGGFLGLRGTNMGILKYPANAKYDPFKIMAWFEECLEGKNKGFASAPAVRYYVMGDVTDPKAPGNQWRNAPDWPVPHTPTPYYLQASGALSLSASTDASAAKTITDDPAHPVPTLGSREHAEEREPVDLRPIESRADVLVFSTPVLEKPLEITGPVKAKVFIKTDVTDTDIAVRLTDVYPDGRSVLITDGIARASARKSDRWRTPVTPGEVTELTVDLWQTSLILNKGHRLRAVISGSNYPRFDLNHHNGKINNVAAGELEKIDRAKLEEYVYAPHPAPDAKVAHTTFLLGGPQASHLILPVPK